MTTPLLNTVYTNSEQPVYNITYRYVLELQQYSIDCVNWGTEKFYQFDRLHAKHPYRTLTFPVLFLLLGFKYDWQYYGTWIRIIFLFAFMRLCYRVGPGLINTIKGGIKLATPPKHNENVQMLDDIYVEGGMTYEEYMDYDTANDDYDRIKLNPSIKEQKALRILNKEREAEDLPKIVPEKFVKADPEKMVHDENALVKLYYSTLKAKYAQPKDTPAQRQIMHDYIYRKWETRQKEFKDARDRDITECLPIAINLMFIPNNTEIEASKMLSSFDAMDRRFWGSNPSGFDRFVKGVLPDNIWYLYWKPAKAGNQ